MGLACPCGGAVGSISRDAPEGGTLGAPAPSWVSAGVVALGRALGSVVQPSRRVLGDWAFPGERVNGRRAGGRAALVFLQTVQVGNWGIKGSGDPGWGGGEAAGKLQSKS